jgi:hypothetical protein
MWRYFSVIWQPPQLQKLCYVTEDAAQGYVKLEWLEIVYDEPKRNVMAYLCYHVWICQEEMLNITIKWEQRIAKILVFYVTSELSGSAWRLAVMHTIGVNINWLGLYHAMIIICDYMRPPVIFMINKYIFCCRV